MKIPSHMRGYTPHRPSAGGPAHRKAVSAKDYGELNHFFPLTRLKPNNFFTRETMDDMREGRCVLCHRPLRSDTRFCLIGRYGPANESDTRQYRSTGTKEGEHVYEASYVPICPHCEKIYSFKAMARSVFFVAAVMLSAMVGIAFMLQHFDLLNPESNIRVALDDTWRPMVIIWIYFLILGCTVGRVFNFQDASAKLVQVDELFNRHGLPRVKLPFQRFVNMRELQRILTTNQYVRYLGL